MLVGRVERIFTRVGGTQLQSLAHPPRGRDLVSELWWDVMLTWLFCIFEGEQLALTQVWCKSTSFSAFFFSFCLSLSLSCLLFCMYSSTLIVSRSRYQCRDEQWPWPLSFHFSTNKLELLFLEKKFKDYHVCINILYIDLVFLKLCLVKSWKIKDNLNNKS